MSNKINPVSIVVTVLLILSAIIGGWFFVQHHKTIPEDSIIDVAIIGGGVSGLYTAYRLTDPSATNSPVIQELKTARGEKPINIAIFEAANRLGGRILTVEIPHSDGLKAELGAMRFMSLQQNVYGLITKQLKLPIEKAGELSNQLFHYTQGKTIQYADYHQHPEKIPYQLSPKEQGKTPGELLLATIETLIPGSTQTNSTLEIEQLLRQTMIPNKNGILKPLYTWSASDLLRTKLSEDAYQMLYDVYGFKAFLEPMNAYDTFLETLRDYKVQAFFKLPEGMSTLINALTAQLQERNVSIYTEHALTGIYLLDSEAENSLFVLSVAGKKYYARHVILTLSPKALQALDQESILFSDPRVVQWLNDSKITPPAQKLFFVYDKPWWKKLNLPNGRVHTDLSAQQLYYWDDTPKAAMMLAAFKDTPVTWPKNCTDRNALYPNREQVPAEVQAPLCLVETITEELKTIHNDPNLPMPHTAVYKDWLPLPIGGPWHIWAIGVKSWELIPKIRKPYPHMNIYLTGDNYARGIGWIEEGINNAENLLISHFGLNRAEWIDPSYDLGP